MVTGSDMDGMRAWSGREGDGENETEEQNNSINILHLV